MVSVGCLERKLMGFLLKIHCFWRTEVTIQQILPIYHLIRKTAKRGWERKKKRERERKQKGQLVQVLLVFSNLPLPTRLECVCSMYSPSSENMLRCIRDNCVKNAASVSISIDSFIQTGGNGLVRESKQKSGSQFQTGKKRKNVTLSNDLDGSNNNSRAEDALSLIMAPVCLSNLIEGFIGPT